MQATEFVQKLDKAAEAGIGELDSRILTLNDTEAKFATDETLLEFLNEITIRHAAELED